MRPRSTDKSSMSDVASDHSAEGIARFFYRKELPQWAGSENPQADARKSVARKIGLLPGTIENLCRGRIKDVRQRVFDALHAAYLRELEREHAALEHELLCLRATGARLNSDEITEVETDLAKVRAALHRGQE